MAGGEGGVDFSDSGGDGMADCSCSVDVVMMNVELERPRCQMNDSGDDLDGRCLRARRRVSRGSKQQRRRRLWGKTGLNKERDKRSKQAYLSRTASKVKSSWH